MCKVNSSMSIVGVCLMLHELKDEVARAWKADDRVTSLKVSIKVARLRDTSVLLFYPTLFVLATDVMDMLGNMVWQRIKRKFEFFEDGNRILMKNIYALMPKKPANRVLQQIEDAEINLCSPFHSHQESLHFRFLNIANSFDTCISTKILTKTPSLLITFHR
ncbi:VPS35 endosomal protein sorting factor-like [Camellia lanceoleosa]|uniref:VPS35 endosomal protein sorting factor-like n=1 Tax=Camellia lanceoleosa TaxID=1840588 RepID=A0ACC0I5C9_9ERIC|nr:VPS35 endosomal protein sorting factor-like [Camellia lanceoleosa]